jgi:acetamidase/formamidase
VATFKVEPNQKTLHGFFSRDLQPVLTIDSGDTVLFKTIDAEWGLENFSITRFAPRVGPPPRKTATTNLEGPKGHALCGPVSIRGTEPGMTLAIHIESIRPGTWGWTVGGETTEGEVLHLWELDPIHMRGRNQLGHEIPLRPFMGVMGMPPAEAGQHSTIPPRLTGGNIDCKELIAGSRLYLPIAVPGGLFSTGDGHAAQGDGEVSNTGIECPMEEAQLTFHLHPDMHIMTPRAWTESCWLTFGFDENLNVAARTAMEAMLDLLVEHRGVSRGDALALASVVVNLRITQIANKVLGVHAMLAHDAWQ